MTFTADTKDFEAAVARCEAIIKEFEKTVDRFNKKCAKAVKLRLSVPTQKRKSIK